MSDPRSEFSLNDRTWRLVESLPLRAQELRVASQRTAQGSLVWDFGCRAPGGLEAGLLLARVCLADLATVALVPDSLAAGTGWQVCVRTDHPQDACMRSQYAGWKITHEKYFAMGSGPMRAVAAVEPLIERLGRESATCAVGVLETSKLPTDDVVTQIVERCGVAPDRVVILAARTKSQAGTVQIVARSVETALHKLTELGFDLSRVVSGAGIAPLPPVAPDDLLGIGRTNDAILYGARVTLWVRGDDDSIRDVIERVPSASSADYGEPFAKIFARYEYDFYRIDPHLFSPARITIVNVDTGHTFHAGDVAPAILAASWAE